MREYHVYFELYGKKMRSTVFATNEEQAKEVVREKLTFHKVEKSKSEFNEALDGIDNWFKKK
jgi:hypothetical protein